MSNTVKSVFGWVLGLGALALVVSIVVGISRGEPNGLTPFTNLRPDGDVTVHPVATTGDSMYFFFFSAWDWLKGALHFLFDGALILGLIGVLATMVAAKTQGPAKLVPAIVAGGALLAVVHSFLAG